MIKKNGYQTGFTLVELMVVIAIIGITAAIAVPNFQNYIKNLRIKTTADSIQSGLQKARAEALKRNARIIFTINNDSSWSYGCVTPVDVDNDGTIDCPATIETRTATESSADISVTPDSGTDITFTSLGTRLVGSGFNSIAVDMSSMDAADSNDLNVTVGPGGNVKLCNPNFDGTADLRKCSI